MDSSQSHNLTDLIRSVKQIQSLNVDPKPDTKTDVDSKTNLNPRFESVGISSSQPSNSRSNNFEHFITNLKSSLEENKPSHYTSLVNTVSNAIEQCIATMLDQPVDTEKYADAWQRLGTFMSIYNALVGTRECFQRIPEWYFREAWPKDNGDEEEDDVVDE